MSYSIPSPAVFLSLSDDVNHHIANSSREKEFDASLDNFKKLSSESGVFMSEMVGGSMQVLSMEHDLYGGPNSPNIILRILDPGGEFEGTILQSANIDFLSKIIKDRIKLLKNTTKPAQSKREALFEESGRIFGGFLGVGGSLGSKGMDLVSRIGQESNHLSLLKNIHSEFEGFKNTLGFTCVVAYGSGDDESEWGGPFVGSIVDMDYSYTGKDGMRVLTLKIAALESVTNQMPFVTWDGVENTEVWGAGDATWDTSVAKQDSRRKFSFEPEWLRLS